MPMQFTPQYWDTCTHRSVAPACLRYIDSSLEPYRWCEGMADEAKRKETTTGLVNCVQRRNILTLHEQWDKWVDYGEGGCLDLRSQPPPFEVSSKLLVVGSTSFQVRFEISSAGKALATCDSTCVCIGGMQGLTEKKAVPNGDDLRATLSSGGETPAQAALLREVPADAFVWSQPVRSTDCDGLGHVNQAMYATLIEEARAAAGKLMPTRSVTIEYLGQPVPGDTLKISVWEADGCEHFHFVAGEKGLVALARLEPSSSWQPWTGPRIS